MHKSRIPQRISIHDRPKAIDDRTEFGHKEIFGSLSDSARKSVTLDNGRENHLRFQLRDQLGIDTFFCDPYSSWQRGCNEHHNGLLRRYLPKGTSFGDLTQEELDDMVWEINLPAGRQAIGRGSAWSIIRLRKNLRGSLSVALQSRM